MTINFYSMTKLYSTALFFLFFLIGTTSFAQIVANPDNLVVPIGATSVNSVLANDSLNNSIVSLNTVTITPLSIPSGLTLNANGTISASPNATAGTYTFMYQICQVGSPNNCSFTTSTVVVGCSIASPTITITQPNCTSNLGSITLDNLPSGLGWSINQFSNGSVSTLSGFGTSTTMYNLTPGTYSFNVTDNTTGCSSANVTATLVSSCGINAVDDVVAAFNGACSGACNVLTNDTINGQSITSSGQVVITQITSNPNISIAADGSISIAASTPMGVYAITYQICIANMPNPATCDTATVTVQVSAGVITANDDTYTAITSTNDVPLGDYTANDTLNGLTVPNGTFTSYVITPNASLDTTPINGVPNVTVIAGTLPGTYSFTYQICDANNPNSCDSATVTIIVVAPLAPTGNTTQSVPNGSTLGNLVVSGQNIQWYANPTLKTTASNALPLSTVLTNGTTYYASQTINGIESTSRLGVTVSLTTLSSADFAFANFNFYPNPIKNHLTLSNATIIDTIEVSSLLGQQVMSQSIDDLQAQLDFSNLSNGIYFVKVVASGQTKTLKVVKN